MICMISLFRAWQGLMVIKKIMNDNGYFNNIFLQLLLLLSIFLCFDSRFFLLWKMGESSVVFPSQNDSKIRPSNFLPKFGK